MTESFSFRDPSGECPMRSEVDHQIQKTLQLPRGQDPSPGSETWSPASIMAEAPAYKG